MGSKSEPPYKAGESWEEFLSRRGIERDKAEPIHEIQWLRGERQWLTRVVEWWYGNRASALAAYRKLKQKEVGRE